MKWIVNALSVLLVTGIFTAGIYFLGQSGYLSLGSGGESFGGRGGGFQGEITSDSQTENLPSEDQANLNGSQSEGRGRNERGGNNPGGEHLGQGGGGFNRSGGFASADIWKNLAIILGITLVVALIDNLIVWQKRKAPESE